MKNSLEKIRETIEKYDMLQKSDRILVAFSGGFDSVCLALSLHDLGYSIALAHVNHNLRAAAKADADFCAEFAKRLKVPFHLAEPDVKGYAKTHKISLETAGRILRYEFFESLGFDKIATAHHSNDCAETVLQHLVRGSGLKGLTGIMPVRENIVRPLIELTRAEIEAFVLSAGITPCTDETNFSADYSRNRIRLNVIPLLEQENEKAVANICKTASLLQADEDYLTQLAGAHVKENTIEIAALKVLPFPLASRALRLAYNHAAGTAKDFELRHIQYILSHLKDHGAILNLGFDVTAYAEYGTLVFAKKQEEQAFCYPLKLGENPLPGLKLTLTLCDSVPESGIYLDAEKLQGKQLFVRSPKPDDYFRPFGSAGGKALNKVLIDLKIPKNKRSTLPLLTTEEEIIWIIGKKRSNAFCCDEHTKKFLKIQEEIVHE